MCGPVLSGQCVVRTYLVNAWACVVGTVCGEDLLWYYLFSRCLNFSESRQETIPRGLNFAHAPGREI